MRRSAPAVLSTFLLAPALAWSHAELTDPTPRSPCVNDTNCKTAPCGTIAAGQVTKTFFVGSSYDISWIETIEHPGNYRLALSTNGELGFDNYILQDLITDTVGPAPHEYAAAWTVPDTANCAPCVMQLIQIMTDNPGTTYYNCADIQILPAGSATPTPTPAPTPTPGPTNPNDPVEVEAYGSCAVGASGVSGIAFSLLALCGVLLVARRLRE